MGANSIRTGHVVPDPQLMDLADEMGFLINDEIFDCWRSAKNPYDYARFFDAWQERDVAAWVRRDRNHPSLLFWSIGNEIYDTHAGPEGADTMRLLMAEVAEHDPERNGVPTFGSNYLPWPNTQACADIIKVAGYNYGERMYAQHHAEHPDWIIYGSETASVVMSRGVYHFPLSQPLLSDDDEQCSSLGNSRTSWGAESLDICLTTERHHPYTLGAVPLDRLGTTSANPRPTTRATATSAWSTRRASPRMPFYVVQAAWLDPAVQADGPTCFPVLGLEPRPGPSTSAPAPTPPAWKLFLDGESLGRRAPDPRQGAHGVLAGGLTAPARCAPSPMTNRARAVAQDERRSFGGQRRAVRKGRPYRAFGATGGSSPSSPSPPPMPAANPVGKRQRPRHRAGARRGACWSGWTMETAPTPTNTRPTSRRLFSGMLLARGGPVTAAQGRSRWRSAPPGPALRRAGR